MVQVAVDAKGCHSPDSMGHLEIVAFRWSCVVVARDLSNEGYGSYGFPGIFISAGCYNNYHSFDSISNGHLFLTILEDGKSKFKVPIYVMFHQNLLDGLQMATFLLCSHMMER